MRRMILPLLFVLVGCLPSPNDDAGVSVSNVPASAAGEIRLIAWNVESGGSDPIIIAEQLGGFSDYDVITLSEVPSASFDLFQSSAGDQFGAVNSATGRADRLQILYNRERFDLIRQDELDEYRGHTLNNGTHRSPLVVHLRDKTSDLIFQVMVNHLARGNEELRNEQAAGLREWARDQTLPTIAIGDFNMDYDFPTAQGNAAFIEMLRDNVWQWVEPEELIDTNWSDPDGDGVDNYPDSMLDFAFVAGPAKVWDPVCRVIVRAGDFPDDETTSDHRPIELIVTPK